MSPSARIGALAAAALSLTVLTPPARCQPANHPTPLRTGEPLAETTARLEKLIPQLLKQGDVPGLSIALIRDGAVVWQHGFGIKSAKTKEPVDNTTVFEAASLGKPMLAYAVMKLVDEGKIDLDKPLNQYLPGNFGVDDPRINQITARHALSHTSGFPNGHGPGQLKIYFNPGERFSYSGDGFDYLAKTVEHITGEDFNTVIQRRVCDPLGMTSTGATWRDDYDKRKASRHNRVGQDVGQAKPRPDQLQLGNVFSVHTTARDYGLFVSAVLNGTGLKPETRQRMLTPVVPVRAGFASSVDRPDAKPLAEVSWGLGWGLQKTGDGLAFWHWGDAGDCKAYVVAYEKPKLGVVFFANSANGLSIAPAIADAAVGGASPGLDWLNYERYDSPGRLLFGQILANGASAALVDYRAKYKDNPAAVTEAQMNNLGYDLLELKRIPDALAVLKQVVADYPKSGNAYDSLAEAYEIAGDKALAIRNYRRSLELDPKNDNAVQHLKKLTADDTKKGGN